MKQEKSYTEKEMVDFANFCIQQQQKRKEEKSVHVDGVTLADWLKWSRV